MKSKDIREIQIASSHLALIFLLLLAIAVVIFLLGVSVGKKYEITKHETKEQKIQATQVETKPLPPQPPLEKKIQAGLDEEKPTTLAQVHKTELPQTKPSLPEKKPEKINPSLPSPLKTGSQSKTQTSESKGYFVQVGAFSKKEAALPLVQELKKLGYQPLILEPLASNKSSLYRVRIGPFSTQQEGEVAKNRVRALIPAAGKAFVVK